MHRVNNVVLDIPISQLVDLGTGQCSLGCINLTYTFTITPKATIMSPISADQHNILYSQQYTNVKKEIIAIKLTICRLGSQLSALFVYDVL